MVEGELVGWGEVLVGGENQLKKRIVVNTFS